ncbi:hypothetical protein IAQ61_008766 [Plenodomus lingam]|uniref:Protein kinase domain-containing protein n=1 Tax=Leptosphaeria maculans (strain JN3 / isolate v23.1.3 / race Av1-4-5-6-7-8) TaxID=985895 RepID=E4ZNI0_LEPMJ|nr:hypothetical protein LEMA_P039400.1 [Plenodomus lingam JN3]KAH9864821.1 hypothetical protein IAQ61_008766 [Plenodomus lingam]CBX93039.1 hypothetical protein LEMA_P039400.1 [Plenodomus lingam JN3]
MPNQSQNATDHTTELAIVSDLNKSWAGSRNREQLKKQLFAVVRRLGAGGDGEVVQWTHLPTKTNLAVKSSHPDDGQAGRMVEEEAKNLIMLGAHDHIVHMIACTQSSVGPQLFLELCDLGCLHDYRDQWCAQEKANGRPAYPSDVTIWKLLKDISLALDFIHNKHQISHVHNDMKPDNILVTRPSGWAPEGGVPIEPTFKITDFARLMAYPAAPDGHFQEFCGTYEYAPPTNERRGPIHPAVDIWGLGASIQTFKTGLPSTVSKEAYIMEMKLRGKPYPKTNGAWRTATVRWQRRVVYRPLDVPASILREDYDLAQIGDDYVPSSYSTECVYRMLLHHKASERVTSAALVKHVVSRADREIAILKASIEANRLFESARKLREKVAVSQVQRLMRAG